MSEAKMEVLGWVLGLAYSDESRKKIDRSFMCTDRGGASLLAWRAIREKWGIIALPYQYVDVHECRRATWVCAVVECHKITHTGGMHDCDKT